MLLATDCKLLIFPSLLCVFMIPFSNSTTTYYEHEQFNITNITQIVNLKNTKANDDCEFIVDDIVNHTNSGLLKPMDNNQTVERRLLVSDDYYHTSNRTKPKICDKDQYCRNYDDKQLTFCFRKCCQRDEMFIADECVVKENITFGIHNFGNFGYTDILPVYYNKPDCDLRPYDKFLIVRNEKGGIMTVKLDKYMEIIPEVHDYCFDMHSEDSDTPPKPNLFICLAKDNIRTECLQIAIYISSVCLLMTIFIYCWRYKFGKIMNWIIVSACLSQLCAFVFISLRQLLPNIEDGCDLISFGTLVGLLSAFSWLGVMCFDVWRTIASMKSKVGKSNIWKRYMYYSIFGWLYPITIGLLAYFENQTNVLPEYLHVNVGFLYRGRRYCKVGNGITKGNFSFLLFYVIPGAIPILCNVVCFTFTIRYIIQARRLIRKSSKPTQDLHNDNRKLAMMVLKLFLIMGVNWVFEVLSQIIDFKTNPVAEIIEVIFDTANCLQGVFIFLIFGLRCRAIKAKLSTFKNNSKSDITLTESI